jgi:hypothetical protein
MAHVRAFDSASPKPLPRSRQLVPNPPPPPRIEPSGPWNDEITLPRAARLPTEVLLPPELAHQAVTPTTVAPTAMDLEPAPITPQAARARRPIDLVAVALAGFALAWITRGLLPAQSSSGAAVQPETPATATPPPSCVPAPQAASHSDISSIPRVALTDLPLLGAARSTTARPGRSRSAHAAHAGPASDGPDRSELARALSQVTRAASGCGERSGPVRLVVSFASSGVPRSIQVSGDDLPAGARSCIIGAASRARIAAFSGDPVSVAKTL